MIRAVLKSNISLNFDVGKLRLSSLVFNMHDFRIWPICGLLRPVTEKLLWLIDQGDLKVAGEG